MIERTFSLLPLGRCLLPWITLNKYLSKCSRSNEIFFFTTSTWNISKARRRTSQVYPFYIGTLSQFTEFKENNLGKVNNCVNAQIWTLTIKMSGDTNVQTNHQCGPSRIPVISFTWATSFLPPTKYDKSQDPNHNRFKEFSKILSYPDFRDD